MTIEAQYGVPTVAMHTDKFDRVVRNVAAVNGMSELRQVFVPQPVMGKSPAELRAYVDGRDPLTGRPVMQEVIEGLTQPFDGRGVGTIEYDRPTPRPGRGSPRMMRQKMHTFPTSPEPESPSEPSYFVWPKTA